MDEVETATEVPKSDKLTIQVGGQSRQVTLQTFPAFTGFELNRRYRVDYRLQSDRTIRNTYTLDVLSYTEVDETPLTNIAEVNDLLGTWQNVEAVFHAVLAYNGIDLELSEEKARFFEHAGEELAATFVAEAALLMRPFLETVGAARGN